MNTDIVTGTRYMADQEFQGSTFPILAREIFEAVRAKYPQGAATPDADRGEKRQGQGA